MANDSRQKTQAAVAALRESLTSCDLAMVADLETGLVLCTDTASTMPHDTLERIANDARTDLSAPWVEAMTAPDQTVSVSRIDAAGCTVVLHPAGGGEIVVCRCTAAPDRAALDRAAGAVFDVLSSTEGA